MIFESLFAKKNIRAHFEKEENVLIKNPYKAWGFIMKVFFSMLFVVVGLSVYKYYLTQKKSVTSGTGEEVASKEAIQIEKLDAILESFKKKEQKTLEYKATPPVFVDPSR